MAELARMRLLLNGWVGAPGINVLHFSPGTSSWADQDAVDAFYDDIDALASTLANVFVSGVTIAADAELPIFDSETGNIIGISAPSTAPTVYTSSAGASRTSRATMMLAQFRTADFVNNRQVRGRMFIGPLAAENITTAGQIESARITDVPTWFSALTSGLGPRLCVWRRPSGPVASDGIYADVTQVTVRPTPSYLSSRLY